MIRNSKMNSGQKANSVRTNLIIHASSELKNLKLDSQTKINSRTITNAESDFTKQNQQIVNLKCEIFSNDYSNPILRTIPLPLRKKSSFKSTDDILIFDYTNYNRDDSTLKPLTPFIMRKSTKANTHANNNSVYKLIDEKIELINTATGFSSNEKTRERTEDGFNYLKELTNKLIKKDKGLNATLNLNNLKDNLNIFEDSLEGSDTDLGSPDK